MTSASLLFCWDAVNRQQFEEADIGFLGLNSVSEHHGSFAGILSTGITGGAIVPVIIGHIADIFGLRSGMSFLYLTFGCVLTVGFWAKPVISNATIDLKAFADTAH